MTEEANNTYSDKLTQQLVKSRIYKKTFTDKNLAKKFALLRFMIDYHLRKPTSTFLKQKIQHAQLPCQHLDEWLTQFQTLTPEITTLYSILEKEYTTKLRRLYPTLITELLYEKYQKTFDTLII